MAQDVFDITRSASVLLEAVRRSAPIARADLPGLTNLSQQSVHRIGEDLLTRELLSAEAPQIQGRGKPSPRLALNGDGAFGIGLSMETDQVAFAVVNLTGDVLTHDRLDVMPNDPQDVRRALGQRIQALDLPANRIAGLGVSMQGYRSTSDTRFTCPPPLGDWSNIELVPFFSQGIDLPYIYAGNNATLGATAELWVGAGKAYRNFTYLSFDYGFGGGLVLNGEPYQGEFMNAGEVSWIYTPQQSLDRPALGSLVAELAADGIRIRSLRHLRETYDPTWSAVDRWLDRVSPALNMIVRGLTAIVDPGAISYGGAAPYALRKALIGRTDPRPTDRLGRTVRGPHLQLSEIEVNPSLLGAALLPIRSRLF